MPPIRPVEARALWRELRVRHAWQFRRGGEFSAIPTGWIRLLESVFIAVGEFEEAGELSRSFYWVQIKEKYGGLRMYYTNDAVLPGGGLQDIRPVAGGVSPLRPSGGRIEDLIQVAVVECERACQVCGLPGNRAPSSRSGVATLCDRHRAAERVGTLDRADRWL